VKLIAGLGNPGRTYEGTRHNVGFDVIDLLIRRHGLVFDAADRARESITARWRRDGDAILLAKPQTFMNLSGRAVRGLAEFYKIAVPDLLIVCDDVNLPLGRLRLRATGTEGGHNGLRSMAEALGTIDYARLRIGVGRGDARRDLADHVTTRFDADEHEAIAAAVARAADAVESWVADGLPQTMNRYNRAEDNQ
jgi:PTH1 family peptidyl-tRNA hydrolase